MYAYMHCQLQADNNTHTSAARALSRLLHVQQTRHISLHCMGVSTWRTCIQRNSALKTSFRWNSLNRLNGEHHSSSGDALTTWWASIAHVSNQLTRTRYSMPASRVKMPTTCVLPAWEGTWPCMVQVVLRSKPNQISHEMKSYIRTFTCTHTRTYVHTYVCKYAYVCIIIYTCVSIICIHIYVHTPTRV